MAVKIQSFEFGEFVFDVQEKVLRNGQRPVPITPKAFVLLQTLIESHGRLVEKEALIKTVWPDSIVEEGNLSFTIALVRKALADSKNEPRFIETVPKRGYRFIADVSEIPASEPTTATPSPIPELPAISPTSPVFLISAFCLLVIASLGITAWYLTRGAIQQQAAILSVDTNIEKLTTDGSTRHVVLSNDGKKAAYVNISSGRQSVWVRDLESSSSIEILPAAEFFYGGLAISSDNNTLFFTRGPYISGTYHFDVYRVPIFGGIPTKLVSKTEGWIDVSPDDQKLSFVRCDYRDEEFCSLGLADAADGKNERTLASRPRPFRISVNAISPDTKSVAFAVGQSLNQSNEFELIEIDIESGREQQITPETFFNINGLAWLPNRSGFLITASRIPIKHFQIWRVGATGVVRPLTRDSETYSELSLDGNAKMLAATQVKGDFKLDLLDLNDASIPPRLLADAVTTDFSPDGKVVFSSRQTGNDEIWKINTDGANQTQLTNDPADDSGPVVSSNGSIYFASNRSGEVHVWRMNNDGSSQTQLTKTDGGFPRFISNDGWIYYHAGRDRSLRRISVDGEVEEMILERKIEHIAFSPDGSKAALFVPSENRDTLFIVSIPEGRDIGHFRLADQNAGLGVLDWTADGKSLAYIQTSPGSHDNSLWLQSVDRQGSLRHIKLGGAEKVTNSMSLAPDGNQFVLCRGGWRHDAVLFTGLK